jgi:hypothetical protein
MICLLPTSAGMQKATTELAEVFQLQIAWPGDDNAEIQWNGGAAELTARAIIDTSLYLVLATADRTGRPWSSPVYFAHHGYAEFFWVSAPEAAHSRNIVVRPQVGIVIFDSHAPIGAGQGVYISAVAEQVGGDDLTQGMETFSRRSLAHGGAGWTVRDVTPRARYCSSDHPKPPLPTTRETAPESADLYSSTVARFATNR